MNGKLRSPAEANGIFASSESSHQYSPMKLAKPALHDDIALADRSPSHSAASNRTRKPFFLQRLSSRVGSKQRRELRKQRQKELEEQIIEERQMPPEEITSSDYKGNNANAAQKVYSPLGNSFAATSPASTIQTAKSNGSRKRRRMKPRIKFLKRAISSPELILQRFHSHPYSNNNKDRDASDGSNRIPTAGSLSSSSSRSSLDLNPNNINSLAERTRVISNAFSPSSKKYERQSGQADRKEVGEDDEIETTIANKAHCSATSILHHSYLPVMESLCGVQRLDTSFDSSLTQLSEKDKKLLLYPPSDKNNKADLRNQYYAAQHSQNPVEASCSTIPEDPTIQESIECIFASQLEDGLKLWDEEYDEFDQDGTHHETTNGIANNNKFFGDPRNPPGHRSFETLEKVKSSSSFRDGLISPSSVHQSRTNRKDSTKAVFASMPQTKKRYEQASLVYVGTFDPSTPKNIINRNTTGISADASTSVDHVNGHCNLDASTVYSNLPDDPLPCSCARSFLPSVEPKDWPQAPLAFRTTPGSGTIVKAIRFSKSREPLWVPGSHMTWDQRLEQHWGRSTEEEQRKKRDQLPHYACCEKCVLLPINNGNESPGESLVVDFESELFVGTMMLRLRHVEGTTPEPYDDNKGYFRGMNRRYQMCIRGRFKEVIPFTELTTGFMLNREFGKLPSKWVVKGALKVVGFFAPQLDIKLDGVPYSITPLGSTPQCINVDVHGENDAIFYDPIHDEKKEMSSMNDDDNDRKQEKQPFSDPVERSNVRMNSLDGVRVESSDPRRSILGLGQKKGEESTSLQRAKLRRKAFDKLYAEKSPDPKTDPNKIYTFEFLQHMLNFQDFTVELGNMMGSLNLEEIFDGQPLPIMACHGDKNLWSFDVWHECLWEQAKKFDAIERQRRQQEQRRPGSP